MTATESKPDLDVILPVDGRITVAGVPAKIRRIKTKEFLSLLGVVTAGMGSALGTVKLDTNDPEQLQADLMALMLVAVPNAIPEFTTFLRAIVEPVDPADQKALSAEMDNPDLDVLLDVIAGMIAQEKDDLAVLAGKARAMITQMGSVFRQDGPPARGAARST